MKQRFGLSSLLAIVLSFQTLAASSGFAFGTKFACCRSENVSCLGGGGATVWYKMLADRALTQIDAKLRCGIYTMRWNTNSCPSDTACSQLPSTPPVAQNQVQLRNDLSTTAFAVVKRMNAGNQYTINAWYEVKPGQTQTFTFSRKACVGFSVNGQDRIGYKQNHGSIYTGEIGNTWVHPTLRTDMTYGSASNGSFSLGVSLNGGTQTYHNSGMSTQSVQNAAASMGLINYKCIVADSGNNLMFVD